MPEEEPVEREATDQPPPTHDPFTRAQIISLVVPAVSFLALIGLLGWGLWTTGGAPSAAPGGTATIAPATATSAPAATASPTIPLPDATATPRLLALAAASATMEAEPTGAGIPPTPPALDASPTPLDSPTPSAAAGSAASPTAPATATAPSPAAASPPAGLPLQGRRIALDPGHGPRDDLGAVLVDPSSGRLILSEDELNLAVGLLCRDLLRARGAIVTLTRETKDTFTAPWPPDTNGDGIKNGQADDLQERIDIINAGWPRASTAGRP